MQNFEIRFFDDSAQDVPRCVAFDVLLECDPASEIRRYRNEHSQREERVIDWFQVTSSYEQRFSPVSPVDVCSGRFPSTTYFLLASSRSPKIWAHSIAVDIDSSSVKRRVTRMEQSKTSVNQNASELCTASRAQRMRKTVVLFAAPTLAFLQTAQTRTRETNTKVKVKDTGPEDTDPRYRYTTAALVFILATFLYYSQNIKACRSA